MTTEEIIEFLNANDFSPRYVWREVNDDVLEEIGEVSVVLQEGGHEGGGETVQLVIHLPKYDLYLRSDASYYSYAGVEDWENWYEVKPVKRMVTFYEIESK